MKDFLIGAVYGVGVTVYIALVTALLILII